MKKRSLTITQLVTAGPMLLIFATCVVLGYNQYRNEYNLYVSHTLELAKVGSQPIVNLMNLSVGGANYANVTDSAAINIYKANKKLLFLEVSGKTDIGGEEFRLIYDAATNKAIRTHYPADYVQSLQEKIQKARAKLEELGNDDPLYERIEGILKDLEREAAGVESDRQIAADALGRNPRPGTREFEGRDYYLDQQRWRIHMLIPTGNQNGGTLWLVLHARDIADLWKQVLGKVLPLNIVVLCIGLLGAWLLAKYIAAPMRSTLNTITKIDQESNLKYRIDLDAENELGVIAKAFNAMMDKLQNIVHQVTNGAEQVANSSTEMQAVTKRSTESVRKQGSDIEQIASAMEEISATAHEVASNITQAADAAQQAAKQADSGTQIVTQTVVYINTIAQEVENASVIIQSLKNYSESVGSVLDTIQNIAEQTNLLALNAAIEAARAGEDGRGFAVVADEVRSLAVKTRQATQEIKQTIELLQGNANNADTVMEQTRKKATEGVDQAALASEALKEILQSISTIETMSVQIATSAEEQNTATRAISENVSRLVVAAQETENDSQYTANNSMQLAELAQNMKDLVSQFHI